MTDDLRKAAEMALEAFEKIYEGCGEVKKDNLSKHSNELATLVRKDCIPQIEALRQALAQPEREWVGLDGEIPGLGLVTEEFYNGMIFAEDILKEKNT
jgi:hypothetical protein